MIIVETTLPNKNEAKKLGAKILKEKLGACIHILPIESFYIWDNEIKNDREVLLKIKTSQELFSSLSKTILQHHPYDIPEIVATDIINIEKRYHSWLKTSLKS